MRKSMDIATKPGELVRFTGIGRPKSDLDDACELLELGQVYIVHSVSVGLFASRVTISEGLFNTAMFENA